jgi:hypothetical protein
MSATDQGRTWRVSLTLHRPPTDAEAERILLRIMSAHQYAVASWEANDFAVTVVAPSAGEAGTAVGDAIRAEYKTDVAGISAMRIGLADFDLS